MLSSVLNGIDLKSITIEQLQELQKEAAATIKQKNREAIYDTPEYHEAKKFESEVITLINSKEDEIRLLRDRINELRNDIKASNEEIKTYFSERNLPLTEKIRSPRNKDRINLNTDIKISDNQELVSFTIIKEDKSKISELLPIDPIKGTVPSHVIEDFFIRNEVEKKGDTARRFSFMIKNKIKKINEEKEK